MEKKYQQDKVAEEIKQNELKKEIQNITDEKKNLTINLREYQTQISVLRSEIAQLRTIVNDKELNRFFFCYSSLLNQFLFTYINLKRARKTQNGCETVVLKNEINILQYFKFIIFF